MTEKKTHLYSHSLVCRLLHNVKLYDITCLDVKAA